MTHLITRSRRLRLGGCGSGFAALLLFGACESGRIPDSAPPPRQVPLEVITTLEDTESFSASGIAQVEGCSVWVAGSAWGVIVEVDLSTGNIREVGRLPVRASGVRLERGDSRHLFAWSVSPPWMARLDTHTERVHPLSVPLHPWIGQTMGPLAVLSSSRVAVAPIGSQQVVRSPRPWAEVVPPLILIQDTSGRWVESVGQIEDQGGEYLSAYVARVRLGSRGDTLLSVNLVNAVLTVYGPLSDPSGPTVIRSVSLPRYFSAPPPQEEVWSADWLQTGGERPRIYATPHLAEATFGPEGQMYVLRNHGFRWNGDDTSLGRRLYARAGRWEPTDQWLEIFSPAGVLLGAYELPNDRAFWLRADDTGRIFLRDAKGITIVRDPTVTALRCGDGPRAITLDALDSPDDATVLAVDVHP